jgi:hypothetical protein
MRTGISLDLVPRSPRYSVHIADSKQVLIKMLKLIGDLQRTG